MKGKAMKELRKNPEKRRINDKITAGFVSRHKD